MRRVLLSPKWVLGHLLALAAAVVCIRLGLWQWHRAHETHSMQNYGYAVQWPIIGLFLVALWVRVLRDEVHPRVGGPTRRGAPALPASRAAPPAAPPPLDAADPEDAELIAYNRYLAALHEQDRRLPGERQSR